MAADDDTRTGSRVDIDRGEGATPAMNRPGPEAGRDIDIIPGNRGRDAPADEEPQGLAGAVRMADDAQNGDPAGLPSDAAGAD